MATNRKIAKKLVDEENGSVTFHFSNDTQVTVNLDDLEEAVQRRAALHGLSQKIGDSYSGSETPEAARTVAEAVIEQLVAGNWNSVSEGSSAPKVGVLAEALSRATGRTLEEASAVVAGMAEEASKALRAHPSIKAAADAIRAEKSAAKAQEAAPLEF